jgi:hypothetical protein
MGNGWYAELSLTVGDGSASPNSPMNHTPVAILSGGTAEPVSAGEEGTTGEGDNAGEGAVVAGGDATQPASSTSKHVALHAFMSSSSDDLVSPG